MAYILIHRERGIFAALGGEVRGTDTPTLFTLDEQDEDDYFIIGQATKFHSKESAQKFVNECFEPEEHSKFKLKELTYENEDNVFATYIEIVKSGYQAWTGNMIDSIPMISTAKH